MTIFALYGEHILSIYAFHTKQKLYICTQSQTNMDKSIIKSIILQNQERIEAIPLQKRKIDFDEKGNYVLVGLRRAGKSFMLYQNIQERIRTGKSQREDILYINFEDDRLQIGGLEDLDTLITAYHEIYTERKPIVYLDEIQIINGWEKFARRLADTQYRVFITGSNANMLSREIATTLGGRFIAREIYPFSFEEYLIYKGIRLDTNWEYAPIATKVRGLFDEYFHYGGFAEIFNRADKREWINSLCQKILLGDIIARNDIRNAPLIRLLVKKLAESVMQPTTQTRLLNILQSTGIKLGRNTISEYLSYMDDAYLTFSITNYTDSLAERISNRKRYFSDNGLLNNYLFDPTTKLLENLVAVTLLKKYGGYEEDNLYYYNKGVEVDFYVPSQELAIQVSYNINDLDTRERETKALLKMASVFPLKKLMIITMDQETTIQEDENSIEVVPVWKWLLK